MGNDPTNCPKCGGPTSWSEATMRVGAVAPASCLRNSYHWAEPSESCRWTGHVVRISDQDVVIYSGEAFAARVGVNMDEIVERLRSDRPYVEAVVSASRELNYAVGMWSVMESNGYKLAYVTTIFDGQELDSARVVETSVGIHAYVNYVNSYGTVKPVVVPGFERGTVRDATMEDGIRAVTSVLVADGWTIHLPVGMR